MRIVDAVGVEHPRSDHAAQLEKVMPVAPVTGEPRCVEAQYGTDLSGAYRGD